MRLSLPKSAHPDFSEPGYQPRGPVEIDWSNPITRGLAMCQFADSQIDLVRGVSFERTNANLYWHRVTQGGVGSGGEQGGKGRSAMNTKLNWHDIGNEGGDVSLFARGTLLSNWDANTGIASAQPDGVNSIFEIEGGSNGANDFVAYQRGGGSSFLNPGAGLIMVNDAVFNLGISDNQASSDLLANINGYAASTTAPSGTLPDNLIYFHDTGFRSSDCIFHISAFWARALSAAELASLNRDPYQILRPAVPTPLFAPAAGKDVAASTEALTLTTYPATITVEKIVRAATEQLTLTTYPATIDSVKANVGVADYAARNARERAKVREEVRRQNAEQAEREAREEAERLEAQAKRLDAQKRKLRSRADRARKAEIEAERKALVAEAVEARLTAEIAAQRAAELRRMEDEDAIAILLLAS